MPESAAAQASGLGVLRAIVPALGQTIRERLAEKLLKRVCCLLQPPAETRACLATLQTISAVGFVTVDWVRTVFEACDNALFAAVSEAVSCQSSERLDAPDCFGALFTLGETALVTVPAQNTGRSVNGNRVPSRALLMSQSLLARSLDFTTLSIDDLAATSAKEHPVPVPAQVRAHAFLCVGKLCVQDQSLAKKLLPLISRELVDTTAEPSVRNNAAVVLADLCICFSGLVEPYVPHLSACLRDATPLVRRQALVLLTRLLQEDFLKWRDALLYRFLVALADEVPEIRSLAKVCLMDQLLPKNAGLLVQHFSEAVYHFNGHTSHPSFNRFPQTEAHRILFSLAGPENTQKRRAIYSLMMDALSDEQKLRVTGRLCEDVLCSVVDGFIDLPAGAPSESSAVGVLRDTLWLLSSPGLKISAAARKATEDRDGDDFDAATQGVAAATEKIMAQLTRRNLMDNVVPIVVELKRLLEKTHSPLLRDVMMYVRDIAKAYSEEVTEILAADKQLATEIEYDLRQLEREEEQVRQQREDQPLLSPVLPPPGSASIKALLSPRQPQRPAQMPTPVSAPRLRRSTSGESASPRAPRQLEPATLTAAPTPSQPLAKRIKREVSFAENAPLSFLQSPVAAPRACSPAAAQAAAPQADVFMFSPEKPGPPPRRGSAGAFGGGAASAAVAPPRRVGRRLELS
eukprot:TRINITY_DN7363_c0_g1_i1.p1 TRINITY_DN7363_c0_g1~~TRINITY_DN7363_c0_g1_i1.p1  ORF type:complete len:688 (-),score=179.56 TRINITY_DN7363_c0_g1_i1:8-2071(-)